MDIKISDVVESLKCRSTSIANENWPIGRVSTDTRTIEKDDLFFALRGERFDAHEFLREAVQKGAKHVVVSDNGHVTAELRKAANFYVVEDTLRAYGDLARHYRNRFSIPAIAITGSSGKTTVKELLAHILSTRFKVLKNTGTENNLVGVPKTLFRLDASHEVAVLEIGTNQPGEIERLSSLISPQIGVVTMIGPSHLEGLKSIEGVKEEKLKILTHLKRGGLLFVNGQDPHLSGVKSGVHRIVRAGFAKETSDVTASQIWCHEKGCSFYMNAGDLYETQMIGRHNILNALLAIGVAETLGVERADIRKAIETFKPVRGRLQFKNIDGILFIDDTYNANPVSFAAALETLKDFKIRERKGVVCGDMLELGEKTEEYHREAGARIAEMLFDFVIAAGPHSKYTVDEALKRGFGSDRIHHAKDSREAGKLCREIAGKGDMVLVKGSRGMQMEKVFECFTTSSTR